VAIEKIGFPAVIKPLFGSDSLSVIRVNDIQEAEHAYAYVLESFQSPYEKLYKYERGNCVYQAYIDGKEFSVECCCQHGEITVVGMHEKMPMSPPFFVETGDYIPPRVTEEVRQALESCAIGGLKALGVQDSLAHVEVKWATRGPQIIEAASRMGGDYTYIATRIVYGADLVQAGCEIALGIPVTTHRNLTGKYVMGHYWIPQHSGVIKRFPTDSLSSLPGVEAFDITKNVGETILVPPDGYESAGWVIVSGTTYEEAECRLEHVVASTELSMRPL
jgi:biotin carboxylase